MDFLEMFLRKGFRQRRRGFLRSDMTLANISLIENDG